MNNKFEIEVWPSAGKIKKVYTSLSILVILATTGLVLGMLFWDEYTYMVKSIKGVVYQSGWPVTLYWWGLILGITGVLAIVLVFFMNDKKNPSLAISKEGLYINQQLIKQTLIDWSNISMIEKNTNSKTPTLSFYFKDSSKIVENQKGIKKVFVKENLKDNKPLKCEINLPPSSFDQFETKVRGYHEKIGG
ncbi:MAG: STM3941 family protein [Brumimicrobium sp.]